MQPMFFICFSQSICVHLLGDAALAAELAPAAGIFIIEYQ